MIIYIIAIKYDQYNCNVILEFGDKGVDSYSLEMWSNEKIWALSNLLLAPWPEI